MQLTTADLARIFAKLNMESAPCKHHVRGWLVEDGKKVLPLHYSHGRKAMPGHVTDKFRRSMHLDQEQFVRMKKCPMTRAEYIAILRDKDLIR